MAIIRQEESKRAEQAWVERNLNLRHTQAVRQCRGVHRPGSAKCDQGKVTRVSPTFGRDGPQGAHHGRVCHLGDTIGRGQDFHIERSGDFLLNRSPGGLVVDGQGCTSDGIGVHIAQHDIGVGHGRFGSGPAITGRAGVRAGALGADP